MIVVDLPFNVYLCLSRDYMCSQAIKIVICIYLTVKNPY